MTLDEVRAEFDERTTIGFAAAESRALSRKLATQLQAAHARIADLEKQKAPGVTGPSDE